MPPESTQSSRPAEFRRYRQALLAVYFTVGGLAILLLGASVVAGLLGPRAKARPLPEPATLLSCHDDVRRLLETLGEMSADLQRETVLGEAQDVTGRWRAFARDWQDEWSDVNQRCRFDELAGTDQHVAYELLARVHRDLVVMKAEYAVMMERFGREQVADVARLREALDRSRADLERSP